MRIRRARPRDFPGLIGLWDRAMADSHSFVEPARLAAERHTLGTVYLPACEVWMAQEGRALAFIALHGPGNIAGLFVDPKFQGRGIGRALLNHVKGTVALHLEVVAPNFNARRFYERCGFQEVGRRQDTDLHEEMILMRQREVQKG